MTTGKADTWNAGQYLNFAAERTRPCQDLAARVAVQSPRRIIDLGCGPGNSTEVLAARWPGAEITGLDNSPQMIEAARKAHPDWRWTQQDIGTWAQQDKERYDVVFSNAAVQWVDDHGTVLPRLLDRVAEGGALAIQVPTGSSEPQNQIMRTIAQSAAWRGKFPRAGVKTWAVHDLPFYYDLLAPRATSVDFWQTTYVHVMPNAEAIVEWYKGTGLRPFLDALSTAADRDAFQGAYLEGVRRAFPPRANGSVLLPFPRLFLIAYR